MSTENKQDDQRRCLTRLVSCGLALCEALETDCVPLTQDQAECKAYIEAWWSVDNPPPGYTPETWEAVERMIAANENSMTTQNENNTQEASSVERLVKRRLDEVQELMSKGKGTWPQPDYVRDETWHRWQGEELALRWVMRQYGEAANDPHQATASEGRPLT